VTPLDIPPAPWSYRLTRAGVMLMITGCAVALVLLALAGSGHCQPVRDAARRGASQYAVPAESVVCYRDKVCKGETHGIHRRLRPM